MFFDSINDMNDLIIDIKAQLKANELDKSLLIKEAFTLWYISVEGKDCENFSEQDVSKFLLKNYSVYKTHFTNDADYNFIIGWMMSIAFWHFGSGINEKDGNILLIKAYKSNSNNSLFKWAVRNELALSDNEIENLTIDISLRYDQLYNYGWLIKEYFLDVIS